MATTPTRARVPVLYIAGAGRSGSTVLERIIADRAGYVAVGETRYAWLRGHDQNELCSCGERFSGCRFWSAVVDDVFGGDPTSLGRFAADQSWLIRLRRTPALRLPAARSGEMNDRLGAFFDDQAALYRSFLANSGSQIVVDSSKYATYGYLLAANPAIDLRVLHLVRDPRAVAFSWQRLRRRPEATAANPFMSRFGARQSVRIWLMDNFLAGGLRRHAARSTLMRYEDFCRGGDELDRALTTLDLPIAPAAARETLPVHSVAGNPSRLQRGPVVVTPDVEWRTEFTGRDRRLVEAMAGPALVRYGYLGSGDRR